MSAENSEEEVNIDIIKTETEDYDEEFDDGEFDSSPKSDEKNKSNSDGLFQNGNSQSHPNSPSDIYPGCIVKVEHAGANHDEAYGSTAHQNGIGGDSDAEFEPSEIDPKKTKKKTSYEYTNEMLQEALDLVHSQNVSILTASRQFGIPRSTLRRYALMIWASTTNKTKGKQETALTSEEEEHLVAMITKMSQAGKYVSTMDVKSTVQHLLDSSNRVVFKDRNRPNAGWVQRFRKRHKHLQIKGSGYTVKRQTPMNLFDVQEWHNEIKSYLESDWGLDVATLFSQENAHRIYNLDEMSIPMNFKQDLIDGNIPSGKIGDEIYTEINILGAISAAGEFTQPLILQKGEGGEEDDIMPLDQSTYGISFSISGKMNPEIFLRWIEAFDRDITEKGIQKPVVIFLDDIFSHFHISVFSYSIKHDIILICLPSQPTCVMHPIAAEFFDPVRGAYRLFCKEHYRTNSHPVTMDQFPDTFLRGWEAVKDDPEIARKISDAFQSYGFVPLNHTASGIPELTKSAVMAHEENIKAENKRCSKALRDQKAKKTIVPKRPAPVEQTVNLMPTVKIRKLDSDIPIKTKPTEDRICTENLSIFKSVSMNNVKPKVQDRYHIDTKIDTKEHHSVSITPTKTNGSSVSKSLSVDRLEGRLDGLKKCIDLMESFIPADSLEVWKTRTSKLKNFPEIPFQMWKAASHLCEDTCSKMDKKHRHSPKPHKIIGSTLLKH